MKCSVFALSSLLALVALVALVALAAPAAAQRPGPGRSGGFGGFGGPGPAGRRPAQGQDIPIVSLDADVQPDGSFTYQYETANGIRARARGQPSLPGPEGPAVVQQGAFEYVGDDGRNYAVQYVADENGYQPQGDHLPVPPPIPEAILRSLEFNAKDYKGEDEEPRGRPGRSRS